jgi:hypothetical protein
MIYKFKSQADADVIMLEPNGDQVLTNMRALLHSVCALTHWTVQSHISMSRLPRQCGSTCEQFTGKSSHVKGFAPQHRTCSHIQVDTCLL